MPEVNRCGWAQNSPNKEYHDQEWGRPVHDDKVLFEFLILEGMQAGLGWVTILNKRENYRSALDGFNPVKVAAYNQTKINELLQNPGIIRNKLKVNSIVTNGKAFLQVQKEFGTFDKYIWSFVDGKPIVNRWQELITNSCKD